MSASHDKRFFLVSFVLHGLVLLIFLIGLDFSAPLPVLENTNKNDVISAKFLSHEETPAPIQPIAKDLPKPEKINPDKVNKDAIALKIDDKKKLKKKPVDIFGKDLLADIKQQTQKTKNLKQKQLKFQYEKILRQQTEQSLRQNLLDEEIKLQGKQARQSQGVINKYKALILQAISERWIIPSQANKKLTSELMIRLAPGGMVMDVQVIKSSGDPSLDSSARAAVLKASPLPVPPDSQAFESFRQFVLKVKPENAVY